MTDKPDGEVIETESVLTYLCQKDHFEIREVTGQLAVQFVMRDAVLIRRHHTIELNDFAWAWMHQVLAKVDGGQLPNTDVQAATNIKTYIKVLGGTGKAECHMDDQQLQDSRTAGDIHHGLLESSFPVTPPGDYSSILRHPPPPPPLHANCKAGSDDMPKYQEKLFNANSHPPGSLADVEYYDPAAAELQRRHDAAMKKIQDAPCHYRTLDILMVVASVVGLLYWAGTGHWMSGVSVAVGWNGCLGLFETPLRKLSVWLFGVDVVGKLSGLVASMLLVGWALMYAGQSIVGVVVCVALALLFSISWAVRPMYHWLTRCPIIGRPTLDWAVVMRRKGVEGFSGPTWIARLDRYELRDDDSPRAWSITSMQLYRIMQRRYWRTRTVAKALKPLKEDRL